MNVSLKYAETHLDDLVSAADRGEEVEITRPEKPPLKLVVVTESAARPSGKRILGAGRGEFRVPSDEEWRAMDEEMAREMNNSPLFPSSES